METAPEARLLGECFLSPDLAPLVEGILARYDEANLSALEPAGLERRVLQAQRSPEAYKLRSLLVQEQGYEQALLPKCIEPIAGWLIRNHGKNNLEYELVRYDEVSATCTECSELVARGLFEYDSKREPSKIHFAAENVIYSMGLEQFLDGNLVCGICGGSDLWITKNADIWFLRQKESPEHRKADVENIFDVVSRVLNSSVAKGLPAITHEKAESAIIDGLNTRFNSLKRVYERGKGKKRKTIESIDYDAVHRVFSLIRHHLLDVEHLPFHPFYKPVLSQAICGEIDPGYASMPQMLGFVRTRAKRWDSYIRKLLGATSGRKDLPHDHAGLRIVLPTVQACYDFAEWAKEMREWNCDNFEDWINPSSPDPKDEKAIERYNQALERGYKSLHMHFHFAGMAGEVQARTWEMNWDSYTDPRQEHKVYTDGQVNILDQERPGLRRILNAIGNPLFDSYDNYLALLVDAFEKQTTGGGVRDYLISLALANMAQNFEGFFADSIDTPLNPDKTKESMVKFDKILRERFKPLTISETWRALHPDDTGTILYVRPGTPKPENLSKYILELEKKVALYERLNRYLSQIGFEPEEVNVGVKILYNALSQIVASEQVGPRKNERIFKYELPGIR